MVLNAQEAIRNVKSLQEALDAVSRVDFSKLRQAMESVSKTLSKTASENAQKTQKSAEESQKAQKKALNLLQQRQALQKRMVDAYSKNPKADLSKQIAQYDRLSKKIADMYMAIEQPEKALKSLREAMIATSNVPWGNNIKKMFSDLSAQINNAKAEMKKLAEDADGTTARKAAKRQAQETARKEEESQKKINAILKENANAEKLNASERKKALDAAQAGFSKYIKLLEKAEALERRIGKYKGSDGWAMSDKQYFNALEKIRSLQSEANRLGATNIASRINGNILDGVNMKNDNMKVPKTTSYENLSSRASELKKTAEEAYVRFKQTKDISDKITFNVARNQLKNLTKDAKALERQLGKVDRSDLNVENILRRIKHRIGYLVMGFTEYLTVGLPMDGFKKIKEYELAMAGVQQVLQGIEGDQAKVTKEFGEFANIAAKYGQSLREVVEAGRSIGRMYGDGDGDKERGIRNTNILTMQAARMATVDNFDMQQATMGLESALSQFNLQTSDSNELLARSNKILDVWTKLAHNGGASAQDLTEGVKAAGAAAYESGVSFEFLNALIATGVRSTAKSGNEIGNTLKSMFSSILSDKNIKNMEQFGIQVYDSNKNLRNMEDIILDISLAMNRSDADAKGLREFMMQVSGGKQQYSKVAATLGNYKELLRTVQEASTSEGFTNEQMAVQMDTIYRKIESIKALFDDVIVEDSGKGVMNDVKYVLEIINNILKGMKELDTDSYAFAKNCIEASAAFFAITKAAPAIGRAIGRAQGTWQSGTTAKDISLRTANRERKAEQQAIIQQRKAEQQATTQSILIAQREAKAQSQASTATRNLTRVRNLDLAANKRVWAQRATGIAQLRSMTTGLKATTVATSALTLASRGLATAMALVGGPIGLLITGIGLAISAYTAYSGVVGEAVAAQEKANEQRENTIAKVEQEMAINEENASRCERLADIYNNLKDKLDSKTLSEEEAKKVTEQMGEIETTVAKIMGDSAVEFDENGKIKKSSIKEVADTSKQATLNLLQEQKSEIQGEIEVTNTKIEQTKKRIDAIKNEIEAYGLLARAMQFYWNRSGDVWKLRAEEYDRQASNPLFTDEVKQQAAQKRDELLAKAQDSYDQGKAYGEPEEYEQDLENLKKQLETQKAQVEEIDNKINLIKSNSIIDKAEKGSSYDQVHQDKEKGSSASEGKIPKDDTLSNQNKIDAAEYKKIKNEYDNEIKKYDTWISKIKADESRYGATDLTTKQLKSLYDARGEAIKGYSSQFKAYGNGLAQKANDLFDSPAVFDDVDTSKVQQGIDAWMGATMDLGDVGCVEAVEKMGSFYSQFLADEFNKGVRYIPTLLQDATEANIQTIRYDASQLEVGDLVVWNNDGDTMNHIGVYKGKDEKGNLMVADNSSGANKIMERSLNRSWQNNEYIVKTGAGNSAGSVSIPNAISHYISKEDWNKLDLKGKRDFVNERSEDNASMKAMLGQINNLMQAQEEVNNLMSDAQKNSIERAKAIESSVQSVISRVEKEADFEGTKKLAELGLDATDIDKAQIELEKLSATISILAEKLPEFDKNTMQYKETEQKLNQARLDWLQKRDAYDSAVKDAPIKKGLEDNDTDYEIRSKNIGSGYNDKQEYLKIKRELLESRWANQLEEYQQARAAGNEKRSGMVAEIEELQRALDAGIEKGKLSKEQIAEQRSEIEKLTIAWQNSAVYGEQSERDKQKALKETESQLADVKNQQNEVTNQLETTIKSGITNMFSGVLLQGNSFKDGWKSLWQSIAQIAIQHILQMYVFEKLFPQGMFNSGGSVAKGGSSSGSYDISQGGGYFNLSPFATGGEIPKFATGGFTNGLIKGAGTGKSDSILTYLQHRGQFIRTSNGEYIMQKSAVDALGTDFLDKLNNAPQGVINSMNLLSKSPEAVKSLKRYASGGSIGYDYVPSMSPETVENYKNYTKTKAQNEKSKNGNAKLEALMQEQTGVLKGMGNNGDGKVVVLNTQVSSNDVLAALAKNPRALNAILGRQSKHGFR